ncbi:MAG: bifunctional nuclease family protein [Propionibacteriaceae bacterium]
MREVVVHGVRIDLPAGVPMLLLREVDGTRGLPIWIGAAEASAIANVLEGATPPRPLTHDLMADLLEALGHTLTAVKITEVEEGTFYAVIEVDGEEVSARPSDAVALALRVGAPIYAADDVLAEVGVEIPAPREEEVEKFREFLDNVSPEDFEAPQES